MRTIIPIHIAPSAQRPFRNARGGNTCPSPRVTLQAAVAPSIGARVRAGVGPEVAVAATPNTASFPVIGDGEGALSVRSSFPTGFNVGDGGADIEVGLCMRR